MTDLATDLAMSGLAKFPFVISGGLMVVAASTCGTGALCLGKIENHSTVMSFLNRIMLFVLGTFLHFVHLAKMYGDYLKAKLSLNNR